MTALKGNPSPVNPGRLTAHHLLAGLEKPAAMIADRMAPHFTAIATAWRGLLRERLKLDQPAVRALAVLRLDSQYETLRSGDLRTYTGWLESQGQAFEGRSVPMDRALAALALYFEACALCVRQ
jgi:hypothetical protein